MRAVEWTAGGVRLIDQTRLPEEETYVVCRTAEEVARAITQMVVRGAPAIGAAAAFLLCDDASWLTGQIVGIDGGLSAGHPPAKMTV